MMKESHNRIVFLDYLRVVSCFLVLVIHASETFYGTGNNLIQSEDHRLWMGIWNGLSRVSVPLFMICSAYLLLPMKDEQSWAEFYKRRFLRVVPPMVSFMVVYAIVPVFFGMSTWSDAWRAIVYIPRNFPKHAEHLWFLYPLLGMYLLIPVLSPWLRTATERQERFVLMIWLVTTCMPYVNRFVGEMWGQCWWNQYYMLYNFAGYPGYLLLAHYIREHIRWKRPKRLVIGFVALLIGALITILLFYIQAVPGSAITLNDIEIGWRFCTLNCVVFTFGTFLLFTCIECPSVGYRLVLDVSQKSYGMYLMHIIFLFIFAPMLTPLIPIWAAIPAIALSTYVVSYVVTKLMSYIPGSKWIVG